MKKIFIIGFISPLLFNIQVQSQCFDFYVKTPNCNNVKACSSGGYTPSQIQQNDSYSKTYAIEIFENGTNDYNCHGYA